MPIGLAIVVALAVIVVVAIVATAWTRANREQCQTEVAIAKALSGKRTTARIDLRRRAKHRVTLDLPDPSRIISSIARLVRGRERGAMLQRRDQILDATKERSVLPPDEHAAR